MTTRMREVVSSRNKNERSSDNNLDVFKRLLQALLEETNIIFFTILTFLLVEVQMVAPSTIGHVHKVIAKDDRSLTCALTVSNVEFFIQN